MTEAVRKRVLNEVRGHFRPELLNRLDDIILFHPLTRAEIKKIVDVQLDSTRSLLASKGLFLEADEKAKEWLAERGYDPVYGARPLKRLITDAILNPFGVKLLEGSFRDGDAVRLTVGSDGEITFEGGVPEAARRASQFALRTVRGGLFARLPIKWKSPPDEKEPPPRKVNPSRWHGLLLLFFAADSAWAQMRPISPSAAPGERPRPVKIDQLHEETPRPALPFSISPEKRLDDDDLREKKTGSFLTGLPHFSSDPVEGLGFGVNAFLNSNGERNDPLFAYTPYRSRLATELSFTTKGQKLAEFEYDAPYIHNTPWRFRVNGGYEDDPNQLYFGNTAASMGGLSLNGQSYSNYDRYSQARDGTRTVNGETVTDSDYNTYRFREAQLGVSLERSFADGKLRAIGGFSASVVQTNTFDGESASVPAGQVTNGESLLSRDVANGVQGLGKAVIDTVRVGLVYDTRDLEPDPGRGIFAEITDEVSTKFLGSTYNFNKVYFQMKTFTSLFPDVFDDLVLAARAALGATIGNVAFYELQDGWSSEGDIEGLGGMRTLRGFKQSRFLAPIMGYANVELRYRFAELKFWGQRFKFKLAPFFDLGRVWDRVSQMGLKGFRADGGAGLRIAWNQSTIIMMDYAVSSEDHQFFLDFDHIF